MRHQNFVKEVCLKMDMTAIGVFIKGYRYLYPHVPDGSITHNAQELYEKYRTTGIVHDERLVEWMHSVLGNKIRIEPPKD